MGTNFYYHTTIAPAHPVVEPFYKLHIGKRSAGWVFALHIHREFEILELADWCRLFVQPGGVIVDEYSKRLELDEILAIIVTGEGYKRRDVGDGICVKHGLGRYDLCEGEFC